MCCFQPMISKCLSFYSIYLWSTCPKKLHAVREEVAACMLCMSSPVKSVDVF